MFECWGPLLGTIILKRFQSKIGTSRRAITLWKDSGWRREETICWMRRNWYRSREHCVVPVITGLYRYVPGEVLLLCVGFNISLCCLTKTLSVVEYLGWVDSFWLFQARFWVLHWLKEVEAAIESYHDRLDFWVGVLQPFTSGQSLW